MSSGSRVRRAWETSFEGFGELSGSSASSVLSRSNHVSASSRSRVYSDEDEGHHGAQVIESTYDSDLEGEGQENFRPVNLQNPRIQRPSPASYTKRSSVTKNVKLASDHRLSGHDATERGAPESPCLDAFLADIISKYGPASAVSVGNQQFLPQTAESDQVTGNHSHMRLPSKQPETLAANIPDQSGNGPEQLEANQYVSPPSSLVNAAFGRADTNRSYSRSRANDGVADVLMQERINPIIVNDEVTDLNASIMSQEIECSKDSQSSDSNSVSQSMDLFVATQAVSSCDDAECSTTSQGSKTATDWAQSPIGSVYSKLQTPDIHSRINDVISDVSQSSSLVTNRRRKKYVKGGLAATLHKLLKRERSEYAMYRHKVTLGSRAAPPAAAPQLRTLGLQVLSKSETLIKGSLDAGWDQELQCRDVHLVVSSLQLEKQQVAAGDRITVYWPWRTLNLQPHGVFVLSSSYCTITKAGTAVTKEPAAETTQIVASKSCACTRNEPCQTSRPYKGPYAFLSV